MASYPAVIELRVDGITQVTRVLDTIHKLDNAIVSIKKTPLAIDSGKATDGIRVLKKEVDDFIFKLGKGTAQLAATTAGINSQAAAFRNLAANAKIGGQAFNLYTQAAEQARQKSSLRGGLAEIAAVSNLYKVGKTAPTQSFKGIDDLIKFGTTIPKNTASLELYRSELLRVLDVVEFGTADYQRLSRAIADVNKQLAVGQGLGAKQGPALAPKLLGGGVLKKRIPAALSSGIIGGGFPLLFGQGAGAAAGGALGGVAGGLLGGGFGFALSIAGTAIGDLVAEGQSIKQLGQDLGFSAQQAQILGTAFKTANTDVEKFTGVVQNIRGLGLELEDQARLIQLTTKLTENYGGQFDKVGNAITSALEAGKVSQATLNQLTSQGINIQQALADKFGVSRDQLLDMAKKGKIGIQDLVDVLVDMGNKGVSATKKPASGMEQLAKAASGLGAALGALGGAISKALAPPLNWLAKQLAFIINLAAQGISAMANLLSGGTAATAAANARARQRLAAEGGPSTGTKYVAVKYQKRLEQLQKEEQGRIPKPSDKVGKINVSGLGQAAPTGGGGSDKAEKAAEREQARIAELVRAQRLITLEYKRQQEYGQKIFAAEMAKDPMLVRRLEGERQLVEWGIETADLLEKESSAAGQLAIAKAQQAKQGLIIQKTQQDLAKLEQERKENAQNTIFNLQQQLALRNATTEAERTRLQIEYEMDALRKGKQYTDPELQQIEALKNALAAPETASEIVQKRIGALQDELLKLNNIGNVSISIASSIGAAFSQAFEGLISGTMTAQEALASFFQSVGDAFIQMASEIIAKQLMMIILQNVLKVLGGPSFGGGGGVTNPIANFNLGAAQYGGGLAGGGPTRVGTPYLVGERGPELFVPGTNGGVMSNSDLRASMGAASGSSGAPILNMSFETTNIGGTEYVSRDQLEAAMAETRRQATRDGAKRGMSMTLDRIQQSPQTRSRIGIR